METLKTPFREFSPAESSAELLASATADAHVLLRARIKDLRLQLSGTPLERAIDDLYRELEARGIDLKPTCYLSDQWGCPSGVPVIGVPFYLAHPNLRRLEGELGGGVESDRDISMYLRHEAGHCFNYAYRLYETPEWRQLFGDYGAPYQEDFKPKPFSRKYVVHIPGWYAQKHPDEDFAETFAVWLTPGLDWRKRYRGWGALKKLEYIDAIAQKLGRTPPLVQSAEPDLEAGQMEETVGDYYRLRDLDEKVDLELGESLDQVLWQLFDGPGKDGVLAEQVLSDHAQDLAQAVSQYAGVSRAVVRSVQDHLRSRARALGLTTRREDTVAVLSRITALLTALAMTYLYTGRFLDPEEPAPPAPQPLNS